MGYKTVDIAGGFEKGKTGNHTGRPFVPVELRGVRRMNSDNLRRLITKCFDMSVQEVEDRRCDASTSSLEMAILSSIAKAISTGNYTNITFLMDRVLGKVKEAPELDVYYDEELDKVPPSEIVAYLRSKTQKPAVIDVEE